MAKVTEGDVRTSPDDSVKGAGSVTDAGSAKGDASDDAIVELFFARDERAIRACDKKYGALIGSICRGILRDERDADECRSDVLLRLWERIPPVRPSSLPGFVSKLSRAAAIDRLRENSAQKQLPTAMTTPLEEIESVLPAKRSVEEEAEAHALAAAINGFLKSERRTSRLIFVYRYFYNLPVAEIAKTLGKNERAVYRELQRQKKRLAAALEKLGYAL